MKPERYFFQWGDQVIHPSDVGRLMQFMVHGLEFRDTNGERFSVSSHIYRHVGITAARHTYGVPAAVLAALHLHHRAASGEVPEATAYYSEMPAQDQLEVQHRYVVELRERGDAIRHELAIADPAQEETELLARSDDATRSVLEQWHTLHPVLFGQCGRHSSPHGGTASAEWSSRLGCSQRRNSSSASAPPLSAPTTLTSLSPTLTSLSPRMLPENALSGVVG